MMITYDNEIENITIKKKAALISLLIGLLMFIMKMTAYLITDSTAIFSDAAESVVHVAATFMAYISILISSKPADKSHLYGHGNIEYFSAGFEGLLIIVAAITIIYTSIKSLILGLVPQQLDFGTTIIAVAGIINLLLGLYLIKQGKKTNSLALVADGKHVLTDSYTSIGVMIGLILVLLTGFTKLDQIIAIIVAINILYTGYKLVRESIGGLMKETDEELLGYLTKKMNQYKRDYWIDIHHLKFFKSAEKVFLDFHIILPYYFTIEQGHLEEKNFEEELQKDNQNTEVRIHTDYCKPELCKYCKYQACEVRNEKFSVDFKWDNNKLIGEPIYEYNDKYN